MAVTVLLRHDTPDGESHFDWMIERGESLMTFRVKDRIDRAGAPTEFEAAALPDHRREYLRYEGAISGGRGSVARVATGDVTVLADEPGRVRLRGRLGGAAGDFDGAAGADGAWRFRFIPEKLAERG